MWLICTEQQHTHTHTYNIISHYILHGFSPWIQISLRYFVWDVLMFHSLICFCWYEEKSWRTITQFILLSFGDELLNNKCWKKKLSSGWTNQSRDPVTEGEKSCLVLAKNSNLSSTVSAQFLRTQEVDFLLIVSTHVSAAFAVSTLASFISTRGFLWLTGRSRFRFYELKMNR